MPRAWSPERLGSLYREVVEDSEREPEQRGSRVVLRPKGE